MLAETEKYVTCERRAYSAEQQYAALKSEILRLQVQMNKLRMKYEPGTVTYIYAVSIKQNAWFFMINKWIK